MFGLSWAQIAIIVLVGVFVLGPERIPTAVTWVVTSLRKVRTMAAGAQAELRREIGPELDELRRQVADLQSLKEIQELRDLRDLHPKRLIGKNILGDEFSGGITGFLGLAEQPVKPSSPGPGAVPTSDPILANGSAQSGSAVGGGSAANGASTTANGGPGAMQAAAPPSMTKLAAPKVVGQFTPRLPAPARPSGGGQQSAPWPGERPLFDPDGT